jgi:hypothetical protein
LSSLASEPEQILECNDGQLGYLGTDIVPGIEAVARSCWANDA